MTQAKKDTAKKVEKPNDAHLCLFEQDISGRSPKSPTYKGKFTLGKVEYEVSDWEREAKNGNDFISCAINKKIG